jgi:hypothetical protein
MIVLAMPCDGMDKCIYSLIILQPKCRSEAKLNNVDKQTKGLMGFEPSSRTIHSITRHRQYDHDYCAPAFSQAYV